MMSDLASNTPRPIFGPKAFKLNQAAARKQGFRIFRAWHSCGCCHVYMAFRSPTRAKRQFDTGLFADVVRDDMGNLYNAVNTGRGFVEIKAPGVKKAKKGVPVLPVVSINHDHAKTQAPSI